MSVQPFLPKEDDRLPDSYCVEVFFHDNKTEEFEAASHAIKDGYLEIVTKEDKWNVIPMTSIKRIEFDKNFSKVLAIHAEKINGSN